MSDPLRVLMSGPLSEFAAGFREELLGRGYRPGTVAKQLQLMAHVSRWLAAHGVEPAALAESRSSGSCGSADDRMCTLRRLTR